MAVMRLSKLKFPALFLWGALLVSFLFPPSLARGDLTPQGYNTLADSQVEEEDAPAPLPLTDLPLYLKADAITYDQDADKTVARGNVEIYHQDGYVLLADEVGYTPATNQLEATGNVKIYNEKGDVVFAERFTGTATFREGKVERPKLLSADNRRFVAVNGEKEGMITRFEKGVYTACNSCKNSDRAPVWQVKAREIVHDEEAHDIIYKDAWIEFWGQPLIYLPYLSQADPTVDRRSGFLGAKIGSSKQLGTTIIPSYHYVVSPSADFTFRPIISTKENPVLQGVYRERFNRGEMHLEGSVTRAKLVKSTTNQNKKGPVTRWHSNSRAAFDLTDNWRLYGRYYRTSDPTYLQKYKFEDGNKFLPDNLQSEFRTEGFFGQDYAAIRGYAFQTTKPDVDQKTIPKIAPYMTYSFVGPANEAWGSNLYGDIGLLNLLRRDGADVRRLTTKLGWQIPLYTDYGDMVTFRTQARFDVYNASHFQPEGYSKRVNVSKGRAFPQAELQWRRPLLNDTDFAMPILISPIVSYVAGPVMGVDNKIPNEDTQGGLELDEASLFSLDRFAGADRLDSGSRVNYGVVTELYPQKWRSAKFFIGQSYAMNKNEAIEQGLGAGKGFSDIVGVLDVEPSEYFKTRYRFLLDKQTGRSRRNQVTFTFGYPMLKLTGDYLYAAKNPTNRAFNGKEQIRGVLSSQVTKDWRAEVNLTRNLGKNGGNLERGISAIYADECFETRFRVAQTYFHNREIKPDTSVTILFALKTLGEFSTGDTLNRTFGTSNRTKK